MRLPFFLLALALCAPLGAQQLRLPPPSQTVATDPAADPFLQALAVREAAATDDFAARIAEAVLRHPQSGIAQAGTDAAAARRQQLRSAIFPRIEAAFIGARALDRDFSGNSTIIESSIPRGRADAQLIVEAPLFDAGAIGRIAGGSARLRAARADAGATGLDTALEAISAHYQLLALAGLADIAAARAERHRTILDATSERVRAGVGAGGDIPRAQAGLAQAEAEATRLQRGREGAAARYTAAFGLPAPLLPMRPQPPASRATSPEAAAALAQSSPAVVAAEAEAEAARADARATARDRLPTLAASVSGTRYNVFDAGPNQEVRGQLILRQGFSTGGLEAARTREAQARARAAGHAADLARQEAIRETITALADVQGIDRLRANLRAAYIADRQTRDTMAEQVRLSRGELLELIRAEDALAASAAALLQAELETDLARFTLTARTGELAAVLGLQTMDPR
ncbi:outer membrane protein [Polymorphobacter multimanifer]|uniref:Outer membrane protein n=2 Tax=Polymorphobacter multimanifer TaxID=1070431 RepID=A0A841LF70_9SPHN|nr:TolC family protein [Polymorphobacter multimanifer]MBB6227618.1 outer membrane protein [Polymorphobacter multimanifer]